MYLNKRFFSRLAHDSLTTVYRLETNILRLYLVYASRQGKQDVVRDFFEKMADALHDKKEWKEWFGKYRITCLKPLAVCCVNINALSSLTWIYPTVWGVNKAGRWALGKVTTIIVPLTSSAILEESRAAPILQTLLQ